MIVNYPPHISGYHYEKEFNECLPSDKQILVIHLKSATFELGMPELIKALTATAGQHYDIAMLYLYGESPPVSFWRTASNIIKTCYGIEHVAVADHGVPVEDPDFIQIPFTLLDLFPNDRPLIASDRQYHFCSLNRSARPERVRLVNHFNNFNILDKGIVSLGSDGVPFPYNEILDPVFANQMPLLIDELGTDRQKSTYEAIPLSVKQSIINVVAEGTAVQVGVHTVEDTYIRPLVSEKTTKAFVCNQFPIWLATPGFVENLRKRGFDVFDDLIDHSYDSELLSVKRIEMVAHEVKKLVDLGIEPLRELVQQHWSRLEYNRHRCIQVAQTDTTQAKKRLRRISRG